MIAPSPVTVPNNVPCRTGLEAAEIAKVIESGQLSGNGPLTRRCNELLHKATGAPGCLTTCSGTAALEMSMLLADLRPGDEVIVPSFTFVSSANVVALRNAVPVFVDIRDDTLNIDEGRIAAAITPKTRAVMAVHYAGVACDMDRLADICHSHRLMLVEDAAQAIGATWRGRPLGRFGTLGAFSFHQTKNVTAGEGGALLVNDPALVPTAEIIWEKGTNRAEFLRGRARNYEWHAASGAFLPSEFACAYLSPQLERLEEITARRLALWSRYHEALEGIELFGARRPIVPEHCGHNGHIYYLLCPTTGSREALEAFLRTRGVVALSHYLPLHDTPAGRRLGRAADPCGRAVDLANRLVRLPLYDSLSLAQQELVIAGVRDFFRQSR